MIRIGVLGGGSWGVALAQLCAAQGHETIIWARSETAVATITDAHRSEYLPGVALHPSLIATTTMSALRNVDAVLSVVPAQAARGVLARVAPHLTPDVPLILCQKGVERSTLALPHQVARDAVPGHPVAVLTGPSFAADVATGLPTAITIAAENMALSKALRDILATPVFRPYPTDDLVGAQVGGAIKNVLAIACGIVVARGMGESARAALVARGFAEMTRLAQAMGGRAGTMAGLSGLGDLVLTCASAQSRNFSLGLRLGDRATEAKAGTVEGAASAAGAVALGQRHGVEMPISTTIAAIVEGKLSVEEAVDALLQRPLPDSE